MTPAPRSRFGLGSLVFYVGDKVMHRTGNWPGVGEVVKVDPHKTLGSLVHVDWPTTTMPVGCDPKTLVRV